MIAAQFLRNLIKAVPYAIHTVLTDNGIQFTNMAHHKYAFHHIIDRVGDEHDIEHRLTKIRHPWTNGQVERMNRTIKEATVKRYHYDSHAQLTAHNSDADFLACHFLAVQTEPRRQPRESGIEWGMLKEQEKAEGQQREREERAGHRRHRED